MISQEREKLFRQVGGWGSPGRVLQIGTPRFWALGEGGGGEGGGEDAIGHPGPLLVVPVFGTCQDNDGSTIGKGWGAPHGVKRRFPNKLLSAVEAFLRIQTGVTRPGLCKAAYDQAEAPAPASCIHMSEGNGTLQRQRALRTSNVRHPPPPRPR